MPNTPSPSIATRAPYVPTRPPFGAMVRYESHASCHDTSVKVPSQTHEIRFSIDSMPFRGSKFMSFYYYFSETPTIQKTMYSQLKNLWFSRFVPFKNHCFWDNILLFLAFWEGHSADLASNYVHFRCLFHPCGSISSQTLTLLCSFGALGEETHANHLGYGGSWVQRGSFEHEGCPKKPGRNVSPTR